MFTFRHLLLNSPSFAPLFHLPDTLPIRLASDFFSPYSRKRQEQNWGNCVSKKKKQSPPEILAHIWKSIVLAAPETKVKKKDLHRN